jgi:hypothetical protein
VEKVVDMYSFAYDKKRRSIMKMTSRKKNIALDMSVLFTSKEVIIDTRKEKMSYLFSVSLAISHASLDKTIAEEREME